MSEISLRKESTTAMSEKLHSQAINYEAGPVITEDFERRLAEITPPALNEFNDTRQKLLDDIDSLSDDRDRVVRDVDVNRAMAPAVFKRTGGEQVFADKMTSLDEQEAMLRSQQEDLDALYRRLGGEKVDALREQLIAETGGKTRATWEPEAIVTERALQRAQQEFAENYSAYQAMSETKNSTDNPATGPIEQEAPEPIKAESADLSPVESKQGNPEALTPYEQMLREKYLSRKFDEADEQKDNQLSADSDESNPEDLTPYEQFLRDKYLGDKFDEVEEQERKQAEELRQLEKLVADARERFVAAKIAVETSFFQKYFGGEKKQMELTEAAEQLKTLELTLAHTKLKSDIEDIKQQAEGGDEIAQLMAAHVFEQRRRTEELTTEKFNEMLDNRSGVKKFGAKIGRWFSRGGKVAQWLKAGGTGVVTGAGVGLAVGGFPITTVVGMASSAAVGGAVKQSVLEERRDLVWIAKDDEEKVKAWQEHLKDVTRSDQADEDVDMLQRMITAGYDESVKESRQRQKDMRERVRGVMGKYAAGYALGGITGGLARNFLMPGAETAQAVGDMTNGADTLQSTPEAPADTLQSTPEAPADMSSATTEAVERASVLPVESTPPAIDYTGKYPWDVAAELFGEGQASDLLYEMAEKAEAAGHNVQWHGDGVNRWVEINGQSDTKAVMEILLQYK